MSNMHANLLSTIFFLLLLIMSIFKTYRGTFFFKILSVQKMYQNLIIWFKESTFNCKSLHERVEQRKARVPGTRVLDCHGQVNPHPSRPVALHDGGVVCTFTVLEHCGIAIRCARVYFHMRIVLWRYEAQQQSLNKKPTYWEK